MQIFATIVSGIVVYLLGQMSMQFILEPIKAFNRQRGDIIYYLYRFQNIIQTKSLTLNESDKEYVGDMGAALAGATSEIPLYDLLSQVAVFNFPSKNDVYRAAEKYTSLAIKFQKKSLSVNDNKEMAEIADLLKVKLYASDRV